MPGDILHTAQPAFLQLEFADETVAQVGPDSRLMLARVPGRRKSPPEHWLYLMDGWMKVTGAKNKPEAGFGLRTPLVEVPGSSSVLVVRGTPGEVTLFVELGSARLAERPEGGAVPLKAGDHYRRKAGTRGVVNPGAMQAFLQEMPRHFRDTLPLRAERWRDRPAPAREAPDFEYADVETWLKAEPALRRPLMQRWRSKARQPAFRAALVSNLKAHPEWDPILFPEKYLPKDPPPSPTAVSPAR
jgi:hypothetical protein